MSGTVTVEALSEVLEELKAERARLEWLLSKRHRHNGQIRIDVGELSVYEECPAIREEIDVARLREKT